MDALRNAASSFTSGSSDAANAGQQTQQGGGGLMDTFNNAAGGGAAGEAKEDYLDKGIDFAQERFMGAGDQSNESAVEQAKDEALSDGIRGYYKQATGSDFPVADK